MLVNKIIYGLSGLLLAASALLMSSCDIKKSNAVPSASFSMIYDHPDQDLSFYPVDMVQTADKGYLVLSVYTDTSLSTFPLIRLMKTDPNGIMIRELLVDASYCSAVPSLFSHGAAWRFVCMDAVNQNIKLMQVDEVISGIEEVAALEGKYPLFLYADSQDDFLVLSFDRIARTSVLAKHSPDGQQHWKKQYNINEDVKYQVESHLRKSGKIYPFFIGEADRGNLTHYFVNCYYNYTMTMLFTKASDGTLTGQLNTFQDDAAISSAIATEANRFSLSRYYVGDNFIFASVELDMNASQGANTFEDMHLPELSDDARVKSIITMINGREVIVFASQTKTNRIVLYFFSLDNGELLTVMYLNASNPVEMASLIATQDKGLAVLAQTYVAGRFPRNALFKLSPGEISF